MDARGAIDVRALSVRRSRVVLTPRCWRQVGGKYPAGDGGKRAVHRGDHEVSRKAIAQGRSECSRCPVCSCAPLFAQIARETAGAASTRSSLRPLISMRANEDANLGRSASRECERIFSRHRPRRRTIQYSRGSSNGIDRPRRTGYPACAGYDGRVALQYFIVIASAAKQSMSPNAVLWIASLRSQ